MLLLGTALLRASTEIGIVMLGKSDVFYCIHTGRLLQELNLHVVQ